MSIPLKDFEHIPTTPAFVIDKAQVLQTLKKLALLKQASGCKRLYSIKALPLSPVLKWLEPYVDGFSVSSLFEARLVREFSIKNSHITSPSLSSKAMSYCTHISFNSLNQYQRLSLNSSPQHSLGLRVNPKLSFLNDERFDPCRSHSKLGINIDELAQIKLPNNIKGFHFHNLFSSQSFQPLIETLELIELKLGDKLAQLEWLNLGGGYLINKISDTGLFIETLQRLQQQYGIQVFIEPGKAIIGEAGYIVSQVIDTFNSDGKNIAVLNSSINHNPEVFEYQKSPEILNTVGHYPAMLVGGSCLAGDIFGHYYFDQPLAIGDTIIFKNVGAYSLIKANRFNGHNLPDIYSYEQQQWQLLKRYHYQDYYQQWS